MRGSMHDKDIREFTIDGKGIHIGKPFRNISGILSGNPTFIVQSELENLNGLFKEE
jgi:circadian clock protein KaiC